MPSPRRPLAAALAGLLALTAPAAIAQEEGAAENPLEQLDPDVKKPARPNRVEEVDPGAGGDTGDDAPPPRRARPGEPAGAETPTPPPRRGAQDVDELILPVKPTPVGSKPLPVAPVPAEVAQPAAAPASLRASLRAIKLPRGSDAQLLDAWAKWRKAVADLDTKAQEAAQQQLIQLRAELAIQDLEPFSMGFIREAEARKKGADVPGAVSLASAAAQLSPHLPAAHFALAEARFEADMLGVAEWGSALLDALAVLWTDPRYARPSLGDVGAGALFALVASTVAVVLTLFARRLRYFLHDFHHLFPGAAARWQSAAMAVLLLSLPVVFRVGLAPLLLTLLAAVCLYLSTAERAVAAVLVASLGAVPLLGGQLAAATAFAGTPAEDVYALERGGLDAPPAAERVARRVSEGKAEYAELFALGRYQLRRGQVDGAMDRLKMAASKRDRDARLLTNLGNAMLARGDADGAAEAYQSAAMADAALAAPLYNASKVYSRRAQVAGADQANQERDRASTARSRANLLDPSLKALQEPPEDDLALNRLLVSPSLAAADLGALAASDTPGDKVVEQLSAGLVGPAGLLAWLYPLVSAAALFALGFASRSGSVSAACDKCGRAVCRKCDPDLPQGSELCVQCINVFVKRNAVAAPVKVRKQLEVDHYQARMGRLSYLFGLACSGAGHVFSGLPVRGVAYIFLFLFVGFSAFYRQGVLRPPYGAVPLALRLAPLGLLFLLVYLLSLRGLYKRQEES